MEFTDGSLIEIYANLLTSTPSNIPEDVAFEFAKLKLEIFEDNLAKEMQYFQRYFDIA